MNICKWGQNFCMNFLFCSETKQEADIKPNLILWSTLTMERTSRELSEQVWHKIVAKQGQSQGYRSTSPDLTVPLSTLHCVIKKSDNTGAIANHSGNSIKCQTDSIWPSEQGTTVPPHSIHHGLSKRGSGDPGRLHCCEVETHLNNLLGECAEDRQDETFFAKEHNLDVNNLKEKSTSLQSNMEGFSDGLA